MNKRSDKFTLGTADTILVAVGTLAVDYVCTSKTEIVEVMPGGKKQYSSIEELEEKISRYGIKKGKYYAGSSVGNFLTQAQQLTFIDPGYAPTHLATAMAMKDPLAKILLDSLDTLHIRYDITDFTDENATNPIALLVESRGYTKILSFKDKRFPAIQVKDPADGKPGVVMIGAAAGHAVESKRNALTYARERGLPVGMITTEGEINEMAKNKPLKGIIEEILKEAAFFACNEDEIRRILSIEKPDIKLAHEKAGLAQQFREVFGNPDINILLSFGAEGSLVLVGNTVVIQKIPDTDRTKIVSTGGAGDTLAGSFVQGVRIKGFDLEGVLWTLPRANRAAQNVLRYADTKTGQATAAEFLEEPSAEFETEIIDL